MTTAAAGARAIVRVDAGWRIGSGHVMRCLTIAAGLREAGVASTFVCRTHDGHMAATIEAAGFAVCLVPVDPAFAVRTDYAGWRGGSLASDIEATRNAMAGIGGADLLLVDHYGLDAAFEQALRPHVRGIVVLDDLYDKPHACDVLIDQNIGHTPELFAPHVAPGTVLLVGADYAPLRRDFADRRAAALARRATVSQPRTLLVAVGGSDHLDVTSRVLAALDPASGLGLDWVETAHIVLAGMAPHLDQVRELVARLPAVRLHVDSRNMPDLMIEADIAIGGSGVTAIERCVMGLPTLIVVMAENQVGSAHRLQSLGATRTLGHGADLTPEGIAGALQALRCDSDGYSRMIAAAARQCDGRGIERILPRIISLLSITRP